MTDDVPWIWEIDVETALQERGVDVATVTQSQRRELIDQLAEELWFSAIGPALDSLAERLTAESRNS